MSNYIRLLRNNPSYTRLWLAQAISLLGDWFSTIALSTIVVHYSNGSGLAVSGLLLAHFLPPLIVGPFAGVLVDRFNRKRLLIISDLARVLIVASLVLVKDASGLWLIYVLVVIQFCFSAIFDPARSAIIPSVVTSEDLVAANLLGSATWSVMLAAGAVIGGVVATLFGTQTALLIDASSFAFSALFIMSIKQKAAAAAELPAEASPSAKKVEKPAEAKSQLGFRDGLRYVAQHPETAAVLLVKLGGSFGSVDALMVIYATRIFVLGENGSESLGIFYGAFGLGAVLGPLLLNRFHGGTVHTMRRLIIAGYAFITVGWFLCGNASLLGLFAFGLLVKAIGSSVYWTYSSVIIQKTVPDSFLGRLFALDLAGFQLATVISVIITGWLLQKATLTQVPTIVIGTGFASMIPLVAWAFIVRWIERREPVPTAQPELGTGG
jgi:MFS family permease